MSPLPSLMSFVGALVMPRGSAAGEQEFLADVERRVDLLFPVKLIELVIMTVRLRIEFMQFQFMTLDARIRLINLYGVLIVTFDGFLKRVRAVAHDIEQEVKYWDTGPTAVGAAASVDA